jgi:hypothetical protein
MQAVGVSYLTNALNSNIVTILHWLGCTTKT